MMKPAGEKIGHSSGGPSGQQVAGTAAIIFLGLVWRELIGTGEAQSAFLAGVANGPIEPTQDDTRLSRKARGQQPGSTTTTTHHLRLSPTSQCTCHRASLPRKATYPSHSVKPMLVHYSNDNLHPPPAAAVTDTPTRVRIDPTTDEL
jgi:hypothetical protein